MVSLLIELAIRERERIGGEGDGVGRALDRFLYQLMDTFIVRIESASRIIFSQ